MLISTLVCLFVQEKSIPAVCSTNYGPATPAPSLKLDPAIAKKKEFEFGKIALPQDKRTFFVAFLTLFCGSKRTFQRSEFSHSKVVGHSKKMAR